MEHDPASREIASVSEDSKQSGLSIFGRIKGWLRKLDYDICGEGSITNVKHFGAAEGYTITIGDPTEVQQALVSFLQKRAP